MYPYPLSLDRRLAQGDNFRRDQERLFHNLSAIQEHWSSGTQDREYSSVGPHTGSFSCARCAEKKRQIRQAYRDYYLSEWPGTWDSDLQEYQQTLKKIFDDGVDLDAIHEHAEVELRRHLKLDLIMPTASDSSNRTWEKDRVCELFNGGADIKHIVESHLAARLEDLPVEEAGFVKALQSTRTAEERAPVYIDYYCRPSSSDDTDQRKLKNDFAREFQQGTASHDALIRAWRKEAEEKQLERISKLREKESDLQMALSAHLKDKVKKAEKVKMIQDRTNISLETTSCSLENCPIDVEIGPTHSPIECMLCYWLARKSKGAPSPRQRYYYCSVEHGNEDFVSLACVSP